MARKAMTGWMLVGTGIGIAAAIVGTRTMKAQNKKGLKSEAVSMIKDGLSGNAAQMAKKTGDVLIKAATNLDNNAKN